MDDHFLNISLRSKDVLVKPAHSYVCACWLIRSRSVNCFFSQGSTLPRL